MTNSGLLAVLAAAVCFAMGLAFLLAGIAEGRPESVQRFHTAAMSLGFAGVILAVLSR